MELAIVYKEVCLRKDGDSVIKSIFENTLYIYFFIYFPSFDLFSNLFINYI
jgi:hypothetical protein